MDSVKEHKFSSLARINATAAAASVPLLLLFLRAETTVVESEREEEDDGLDTAKYGSEGGC